MDARQPRLELPPKSKVSPKICDRYIFLPAAKPLVYNRQLSSTSSWISIFSFSSQSTRYLLVHRLIPMVDPMPTCICTVNVPHIGYFTIAFVYRAINNSCSYFFRSVWTGSNLLVGSSPQGKDVIGLKNASNLSFQAESRGIAESVKCYKLLRSMQ